MEFTVMDGTRPESGRRAKWWSKELEDAILATKDNGKMVGLACEGAKAQQTLAGCLHSWARRVRGISLKTKRTEGTLIVWVPTKRERKSSIPSAKYVKKVQGSEAAHA